MIAPPAIIPQPSSLRAISGDAFVLGPDTAIICEGAATLLHAQFRERLKRATGFEFPDSRNGHAGKILLRLDSSLHDRLGAEGYTLSANTAEILLTAATETGLFYAVQTLYQLLPPAIFEQVPRHDFQWKIPCVEIEDRPRFGWRGAMLDVSRHFMPVEFVKKFLDLIALHKLNVFHWHLTDDQGWRIEIKKYPRLTQIGAWRSETQRGHSNAPTDGDGTPHGGYYTQEQIREVVAYAAAQHITIVPEIDMPGHMQAAVAAYPELGCTSLPVSVGTDWGIFKNILNLDESTILFAQNVLTEVMDLFPGKFIHIGGDEADKSQWEASEKMHARLKEVGARDFHELQSYFTRRMQEFLGMHGRRLIGWDEILEGGLAPGATVMSWRGEDGGIAAAQAGHDTVMAPSSHTYLDHYQSDRPEMEPLAIGGFLPLKKVYNYDPVPSVLNAMESKHVLGVQAQLWTEYMPHTGHVEYMAFPRLCALSEVGWSDVKQKDFTGFTARLNIHLKRLDMLGVKYRPLDRV
ncbi:MAG: beta-N-acetylhexosaminidase [Chthoniobacteraceae bacterium]